MTATGLSPWRRYLYILWPLNLQRLHWSDSPLNLFFFLAVLSLRYYTWAFSSYDEQGLLSSCGVRAPHCSGFSGCGAWTPEHRLQWLWCRGLVACSMSNFLGPGIELMSPALAGGFSTTEPPEKYPLSL